MWDILRVLSLILVTTLQGISIPKPSDLPEAWWAHHLNQNFSDFRASDSFYCASVRFF